MNVPPVLNRIWLGADPPQDFQDNADSWRDFGFKVKEWDEASILALGLENQALWDWAPSHQPSRLVPRLLSDIARYEILWRYGGIYADHDFRCLKDPKPYIRDASAFAVWEKPGLIANGFMGCVKGHPFMRELIDRLADSVRKQPHQQTWRTAGPGFVTKVAKNRPKHELTILPTEKFLPVHHTNRSAEMPADAVLAHSWGSARQQVSVIIPWRKDGPERQAALDLVLERYRVHRDWQVVLADHEDGEFNKAAACNEAVKRSFGDVLVIADADLLCPGVEDAVEMVRHGARWVMPYKMLYRLNRESTAQVLSGRDPSAFKSRTCLDIPAYSGVLGGGIVVLSRRGYEQVSMDVRFSGWGGEDISWGLALRSLLGTPRYVEGPLFHLWHPSQHIGADKGSPENFALYQRYAKAKNPQQMRNLVRESKRVRV